MNRQYIVKQYLGDQEVYDIIGHSVIVYWKLVVQYLSILFLLLFIYLILAHYSFSSQIIERTISISALILYIKGLYDFIDRYLDVLVITNKGLVLLQRNGLFSYSTDYFQRISLDSVSEEKNSFRDSIFGKGDIKIRLEDKEYVFRDVLKPKIQVSKIIHRKDKILGRFQYSENELEEDNTQKKYELLIEALGEVVNEYVKKKKEY